MILPRRCTNLHGCGHIPPEKKPIVIVVGIIVGFIVVAVFLFSCFGDRGKKEGTNTTTNAGDQQPSSGTAGLETTGGGGDGFNDAQSQGPPPPMYEETPPPPTYQRDGDGDYAGALQPPRVRTGEMAPRYA
ncbi:hypothetical protein B0T09DRAFT_105972 [Sordaria sp. MPI-SDFR-AT-0083]|nr:hypothetical protein B0T09DRAFT_105972 [Sordaria sp. MPI-SDFR-AT-0083]